MGRRAPPRRDLDVPLSRAIATADPACRALGVAPRREPDLRECDFGVVEGRTLAEFAAEVPEAAEAFRADPVTYPFPGAEDPREAAARGAGALCRIAAAHPDERVLVVAHNTLLRLVLCTLLSIPLGEYRRVFRGCATRRSPNCASAKTDPPHFSHSMCRASRTGRSTMGP